ncbi:hypothetical protein ElP_01960 [Tautonia plasticadhaerens]|uniref:Helix-turn-helix domain protein n=1 Tax=Tautonia plasticadhaerens TaxID=2527974 RepID=A0A518GUU8_9BACT|nr:hypothetical protein ElP_01960 [Tautonia plasticadhaerens]
MNRDVDAYRRVDADCSMPGEAMGSTPIGRVTWRLADIAEALGVSRRALERERSAGRLPKPDLTIGRMPLWRPETIRGWIERGGRP